MISGNRVVLHTSTGSINKFNLHSVSWDDIVEFEVGGTFVMFMTLQKTAAAIGRSLGEWASLAEISNTGHLCVDVLSANASVVGASGRLYATGTPVPETASFSCSRLGWQV